MTDSNRRPNAGSVLSLPLDEYRKLERMAGNDPTSSVWKTEALPLDDTRLKWIWRR